MSYTITCECGEETKVSNNTSIEESRKEILSLDLNLDEEDLAYSSIEIDCSKCGNFIRLEFE